MLQIQRYEMQPCFGQRVELPGAGQDDVKHIAVSLGLK